MGGKFLSKIKAQRELIWYGLAMGMLLLLLRWLQFRFLMHSYQIEIYGGMIALVFMGLGIWITLKLARPKQLPTSEIMADPSFKANEAERQSRRISKREMEVLALITKGMSNQEIADALFISLNTVKSHSSRIFEKLEAKNRVQAIKTAKNLGLLP